MTGDFSRLRFDPLKGYSRVLMQQGRVMLDADWNEQSAVMLHLVRSLGADLIGPHGGPAEHLGFTIAPTTVEGKDDLEIFGGRYYLDGIACELEAKRDAAGNPTRAASYLEQPFYPDPKLAVPTTPYLVYLDVWERHITGLEDEDILEVALGGPDTATRAQVVWQVKVLSRDLLPDSLDLTNLDCANFPLEDFRRFLRGSTRGALKARAQNPERDDDPCTTSAEARYRGPENQLYRVEIHAVDEAGEATFKWSRENGSVAVRWLDTNGSELQVGGVRDEARGFRAGNWVELTYDGLELRGEAGVMARLAKVEGDRLTVDPTTATGTIAADPRHLHNAKVRRWEQRETKTVTLVGGVIPVRESAEDWLELEDGVQIQFQPAANGPNQYRMGDFWLIPARVATGDVIWPGDPNDPDALPPCGVAHHYAPLCLVTGAANVDLRRRFAGLAAC